MGDVYQAKAQYNSALICYEAAVTIQEQTLPGDNKMFGITYTTMGLTYPRIKEYPLSLKDYTEALRIFRKNLPHNHPHIQCVESSIGIVKEKMR